MCIRDRRIAVRLIGQRSQYGICWSTSPTQYRGDTARVYFWLFRFPRLALLNSNNSATTRGVFTFIELGSHGGNILASATTVILLPRSVSFSFCIPKTNILIDISTFLKCIKSVSYTHLDVYKRQILYWIFSYKKYIKKLFSLV